MKWTSLNDLREMYLSFFESKGHLRLGSFSLVPENDKSLLLINAGMAPLKKFFTGEEEPPRHRVTTWIKSASALSISTTSERPRATAHISRCSATSLSEIISRRKRSPGRGNS